MLCWNLGVFLLCIGQIFPIAHVSSTALSNDEIQQMLDKHNSLRSATALGNTPGQPMAKDMIKLEWNETLSLAASLYANQCIWGNDNNRGNDVGENIYGTGWSSGPGIEPSFNYDLTIAVDQWFNEYSVYTHNSRSCNPSGFISTCDNYAQVVNANSLQVGCAYAECSKELFGLPAELYIVCRYSPASKSAIIASPYSSTALENEVVSECPSNFAENMSTGLCENSSNPISSEIVPIDVTYNGIDASLQYAIGEEHTVDDLSVQVLDGNCSPGSESKTADAFEAIPSLSNGDASVQVMIDKSKVTEADSTVFTNAVITYCLRFCIKYGGEVVNYHDTIMNLQIDLQRNVTTDDVGTDGVDATSETKSISFDVDAFYCDSSGELITGSIVINPGKSIKVCVNVAENEGASIEKLSDFSWNKVSGNSQLAINGNGVEADSLTFVSCSPGSASCFFESLFIVEFFESSGIVSGAGDVHLQVSENRMMLQTNNDESNLNHEQDIYNANEDSSTEVSRIRIPPIQVASLDGSILSKDYDITSSFINAPIFSCCILFISVFFFCV